MRRQRLASRTAATHASVSGTVADVADLPHPLTGRRGPTVVIDSAVLRLATNYQFREASGTLAFSVHEILTGWSQDSLTWENTLDAAFATASPAYGLLRTISAADTFVTVHVDSLVRKWVASGTNAPNGLLLLPNLISANTIAGSKPAAGLETKPTITSGLVRKPPEWMECTIVLKSIGTSGPEMRVSSVVPVV